MKGITFNYHKRLCFCIALISFLIIAKPSMAEDQPEKENPNLVMESTYKIMGQNGTIGTVFFVQNPSVKENSKTLILVTAAHVLEKIDHDYATLFLRKKEGNNYFSVPWLYQIRQAGKPLWMKHPEADVAVMMITLPDGLDSKSIPLEKLATDQTLERYECYPGRNVKILGYPLNFQSTSAGFSILRTGDISSFPLAPAKELKTFFVDFRVFAGNSGGPVYFNEADWPKNDFYNTILGPQTVNMVLGLVSEQIIIKQTESTINQDTTYKNPLSIAKIVHSELIRETIDLLSRNTPSDKVGRPIRNQSFILSALERLENESVPQEKIEQIESKILKWEETPTEANWETAYGSVDFAAKGYNVVSSLSIDSKPKSGALIKYQTVGERKRNEPPLTANQLTKCKTTFPIGRYYIWAERNGKKTSDENKTFEIVKPEDNVEIEEYAK